MTAILAVILQIALLLIRHYFNRDQDQEKAIAQLRAAQSMLSELATEYEQNIRFLGPTKADTDRLQDMLDDDRKKNL